MPILQEYQTYLSNGAGTISGTVTLRPFNFNRKSITIQNLGSAVLWVGGSVVNDLNGLKIDVNDSLTLNGVAGAAVYCYSSGTCNIRFIEEIA